MNKRSNTWKRLTALCLSLLLAVGIFSATAFAAPIAESTGSIKVTGVEDGVTVSAYKVLDVNFNYGEQQPVDPVYVWSDEVKTWVRDNYSSYIGTDDSVTETFTEDQLNAGQKAGFYDALAAAIKNNTITFTARGTCTGNGTISSLPMGGYPLLIENGMKVYRPSAVNIVPEYDETAQEWKMSTPSLEVKSSSMDIEKKVNEDKEDGHDPDVSDKGAIGDTVNFDLRADVPKYPANASAKNYAISDILSAGLSLTGDSIKVYGVNADGETLLTKDTAYSIDTKRPNPAAASETTSFTLNFVYDEIAAYTQIHVDYDAVISGNAVVVTGENTNKAILDYNNNPYDSSSWKDTPDDVKVYTYGLKIRKVNKQDELLTGAEFTLSKNSDGSNPLTLVKTDDGAYRLALTGEQETTTLVTGENGDAKGKLTISGLSTGTYYLTETKAPGGYNKPNTPVTIEIKDDNLDGKPTSGNSSEFADGYVALDVINTQGFVLPTTGGMGTILFTAGGVAIMGAAVLLFVVLRRRKGVSNR